MADPMPIHPSAEQKIALSEVVLKYAITGPVERPVMAFLFEESIRTGDKPQHISDMHIHERFPKIAQDSVRTLISRIRKDLEQFFSEHPYGRQERYKVVIENREYALAYDVNDPPPMTREYVRSFWAPYYNTSTNPVRILYPEPPFLTDAKFAYHYHSAAALSPTDHLGIANSKEKLQLQYPFVPSGVVRAVAILLHDLQLSPGAKAIAEAMRPTNELLNQDQDIILLGSPIDLPQISQCEIECPMRSTQDSITYPTDDGEIESSTDDQYDAKKKTDLITYWGLVTRNSRLVKGRYATTVSARNGRVIEAIATYLTRENEVKVIAGLLDICNTFPDRFQVLFQASLLNAPGEPKVHNLKPVRAVDLDIPGSIMAL